MHRFLPLSAILLVLGAVLCIPLPAAAEVSHPSAIGLDVLVPLPPSPVPFDGNVHLIYELHLTNMKSTVLELTGLEVLDHDERIVGTYTGGQIEDLLTRPGLPAEGGSRRMLTGGMRAIVFLDLSFATAADLPSSLSHRIAVNLISAKGDKKAHTFTTEPMTLSNNLPRVITSPLAGSRWLAANGISNNSDHRRSLVVVDGKARIAQRFATDFTRLKDGQAFHDDPAVNANWFAYGSKVLAVADGVVVDVHDGVPENHPGAEAMAVPITLQTVGGNYVSWILDVVSSLFMLTFNRDRSGYVLARKCGAAKFWPFSEIRATPMLPICTSTLRTETHRLDPRVCRMSWTRSTSKENSTP